MPLTGRRLTVRERHRNYWVCPAERRLPSIRAPAEAGAGRVVVFPVSSAVNSVKNDAPGLTERTGPNLDPGAPYPGAPYPGAPNPEPVKPGQGRLF